MCDTAGIYGIAELNNAPHQKQAKVPGTVWVAKQEAIEKQMKFNIVFTLVFLMLLSIFAIITGLGLFFSFAQPNTSNSSWIFTSLIAIYALYPFIATTGYFVTKRAAQGFNKYELGADRNYLILRHIKTNNRTIVSGKDIEYTQFTFYAGGVFFQFKNPKLGVAYDPETFNQHVLPIIKQGTRISERQMIMRLLRRVLP